MRRSDLWGYGIASCTWALAGEDPAPSHENKGLGQRTGYIPWNALRTPERTIRVSHRFGKLDYERLGATPVESGTDRFGPYDVFIVQRDWFEAGEQWFSFAGRDMIPLRSANIKTSAIGDAYMDPTAGSMSRDWDIDGQKPAFANRGQRDFKLWLTRQMFNPTYGDRARELLTEAGVPARRAEVLDAGGAVLRPSHGDVVILDDYRDPLVFECPAGVGSLEEAAALAAEGGIALKSHAASLWELGERGFFDDFWRRETVLMQPSPPAVKRILASSARAGQTDPPRLQSYARALADALPSHGRPGDRACRQEDRAASRTPGRPHR